MRLLLICFLTSLFALPAQGQARTDAFLTNLIKSNRHPVIQQVMQQPEAYRVQIIYTQIDRDKANRPSFTNHYFRVDSTEYFNPASTVKLPLALLSLEKLNDLNKPQVTKFTAMQFDSAYSGQTKHWYDKTAESGYPSIAHLIRKAFLVSENDPYSRMYEFVGQLESLHQILQATMFPESVPQKQRFNLTADDYTFLYQYLSQFPGETNYPKYDARQYYDSYAKFFFRDSLHRLPGGLRVFNKVGWAYGFLTDASYVADFKNKVEYLLTAVIYANSDEILNDDKYDYDTVGYPFLYQLGQTIHRYELNRKRQYKPDLTRFRAHYEKRTADGRPTVKNVDN